MPPTAEELRAQLAEAEAAEKAEQQAAAEQPIHEQVKTLIDETGTTFVDALKQVAGKLKEAGKIGESDIVTEAESGAFGATVVKLLGELVSKL